MSDTTKITHVEATPKGEAFDAALQAGFTHGGKYMRAEAEMIAAALDAYVQAREIQHAFSTVRLMRPAPGDVVVFHFREWLDQSEIDGFAERMKAELLHFEDVKFIAVCGVTDITVVRPQEQSDGMERLRRAHDKIAEGQADGQR